MYRFEKTNSRQRFAPARKAGANEHCGRFCVPQTLVEKLNDFLHRQIARMNMPPSGHGAKAPGVPGNWNILFDYLHKESITSSPKPVVFPAHNDRPKFFNMRFDPCLDAPTDGRKDTFAGFGASFSFEHALSKAIGETLERTLLSRYTRDTFVHASYAELVRTKNRALDVEDLNGFLSWQKELIPELGGDRDTPLYWVAGVEYASNRATMLPAQLVFWNYVHASGPNDLPGEQILARATTNGSAGHFTYPEAVLGGLLESIQRDGFLIYWLNRLSPPVIDVRVAESERIRTLLSYLDRYRLEALFLNTTTDVGVPSITCVIIDRTGEAPVISLGGAAGFDLDEMVEHSALEALIHSALAARREPYDLPDDYRPLADTSLTRQQRIGLWRGSDMFAKFEFLISGTKQPVGDFVPQTMPQTPRDQLAYVLGRFEKLGKGYEVYVYTPRHKVLDAIGYTVARTIVPQLVPLYFAEFAVPLDSRRLREVPEKLGFKPAKEYNPLPHPFP